MLANIGDGTDADAKASALLALAAKRLSSVANTRRQKVQEASIRLTR